jgi:PGF-CTERM protein
VPTESTATTVDGGGATDGESGATTDDASGVTTESSPGFGFGVAVVALLGVVLAWRRSAE